MGPKKRQASKASLKKAGTMAATAAAGQEFLKKAWGADKLNRVNELLKARDKSDASNDDETSSAPTTTADAAATASSSTTSKTKAKPKLSKATTMKNTAKEAKVLIGTRVLGGTRADTKRRQAAVKATKALQEVTKPTQARKPALKRLGTMAKTAREGKAYVQRVATNKKATGRKRNVGRAKNATK